MVFFLFSLLVVALMAVLHVHHQRVSERWLQRTFDALPFQTAQGRQFGRDVRVVKRVVVDSSRHHQPLTAFWYCVGAGSDYFVAVAHAQPSWRGSHYQWTVRPLDEARMRGALIDDEEALQATFGVASHDTLHA